MGDVILALIMLVLFGTMYLIGRTYAGTQIKKDRDFLAAFGRSLFLLGLVTVLFLIPISIASALSYQAFPEAYEQAFANTSAVDTIIDTLFGIFGLIAMLGAPFFFGLWLRYRRLAVNTASA